MYKIIKFLSLAICISIYVFILSCSSANIKKDNTGTHIYNLGKASEYDILQTIPRIIRKYKFQVLHNYDTGSYHTYESEWKNRYPFEDERKIDILEGRMKIIMRTRKTQDKLEYVQLEVNNMVRIPDAPDWINAPMSKMVKKDLDRMITELKHEFDEGRLRRK